MSQSVCATVAEPKIYRPTFLADRTNRSRYWYTVASVCLSVVCNVMYRG